MELAPGLHRFRKPSQPCPCHVENKFYKEHKQKIEERNKLLLLVLLTGIRL